MHDAAGFKSNLVNRPSYDRPRTALNVLRELLRNINRHAVLQRKTRLFCAECCALRDVRDVFPSHVALLECQHRRSIADGGRPELLDQQIWKLEREIEQEKTDGKEIE